MKRSEQGQWLPCPAGELTRLADRLRMRRLWSGLLLGAVGVLVAAAVAVGGWRLAASDLVRARGPGPNPATDCIPMTPGPDYTPIARP
jgi:hypothetical protein